MATFSKVLFTLLVFISLNSYAQDEKIYLSGSEVLKILTASKVSYQILSTEDLDTISIEDYDKYLYPQLIEHVEFPLVIVKDGEQILTSWDVDTTALNEIGEGEVYFKTKDYENANIHYKKAAEISPNLYFAYLNIGDCYWLTKNYKEALSNYQKAKEINPNDYRVYMYQASVYNSMGDHGTALENYIKALTLKPKHGNIMSLLNKHKDDYDIKIYDNSPKPKSIYFREKDGFKIFSSNTGWDMYAMTKAMFKGEPDVAEKYLGSSNFYWSLEEETQAFVLTLDAYEVMKENNESNEYFERVISILKDGYFQSFLLYEVGSQLNPDIMLTMDDSVRKNVEEYIKKYVIVEN